MLDPATVIDRATFEAPTRPAAGIHRVLVNGVTAWLDGHAGAERAGRLLRRAEPAAA